MMERRAFVGRVFAGLALTAQWAKPAKAKPGSIPLREFGGTGVKLTMIGQGGAKLAYLRTREAAGEHVKFALEMGINYFDCARSYWEGHSEGAAHYLPAYAGNLDIMTSAALKTAERLAGRIAN
jgi:hypothetical protein